MLGRRPRMKNGMSAGVIDLHDLYAFAKRFAM
jgi:hypothetical protein